MFLLTKFHISFSKVIMHRNLSLKSKYTLNSSEIRRSFLEFFINQHEHKFIKSSPVIPFYDPTLAFVNAGMNQFKSIFLGKAKPTHKKVTNSQKCIRVGGKHNDISIVGRDCYHHTFFEMLGNWSFGDYFKERACEMAIEFLRESLKIDQSRLYVTYFGGDKNLNLPADLECFEIWRSLGFQENRILPFGSSDNFWEMGSFGPCGPCTEIHIDRLDSECNANRAEFVNTGRDDLIELWNLVFIEHNRTADDLLVTLPQRHVDTGMGIERLTAVIQGKKSNYDTDLFSPIISAISKECGSPVYTGTFKKNNENYELDTAYRIVADHSRMITACLADGMLPDQNQKLRRIIRTVISLSENIFRNENLPNCMIPVVVNILGPTYTEMIQNIDSIIDIIEHEKEIFKTLKQNSSKDVKEILVKYPKLNEIDFIDYPGFLSAFKELQNEKQYFHSGIIPGKFLFKLRDTYGLNNDIIEQIAEIENLDLDIDGLLKEISITKEKLKKSAFTISTTGENLSNWKVNNSIVEYTLKLPDTNEKFKYFYEFDKNKGIFEVCTLNAKILGIFENGKEVKNVNSSNENIIGIVTDRSNFYYERGGQESDRGFLTIESNDHTRFDVIGVEKVNGCIIHIGKFSNKDKNVVLNVNENVSLSIDNKHRTCNIIHHTGTHLLNAAVRVLCKKVVYQISSSVTSQNLKLELGIIGKKIILDDIAAIENLVKKVITLGLPVTVTTKSAAEILEMSDIVTVPGEIYPEFGLRLVEIINNSEDFTSKELCCGTHASNTSELNEFCITNFKQISRAKYSFTAICGNQAEKIIFTSKNYIQRTNNLEKKFKEDPERFSVIEKELKRLRNELAHSEIILSYVLKMECLKKINILTKTIKELSRSNLKNFVEIEMTNLLQQRSKETNPFIIHFLKSSSLMEAVPLQKATKLCSDRPILVISLDDGKIKARCCVPKNKISSKFSAELWLKEFSDVFKGQLSPPKGHNSQEVCNMKAKKVLSSTYNDQLDLAMKKAEKYAAKNL